MKYIPGINKNRTCVIPSLLLTKKMAHESGTQICQKFASFLGQLDDKNLCLLACCCASTEMCETFLLNVFVFFGVVD